jgi:hypothetical protein
MKGTIMTTYEDSTPAQLRRRERELKEELARRATPSQKAAARLGYANATDVDEGDDDGLTASQKAARHLGYGR